MRQRTRLRNRLDPGRRRPPGGPRFLRASAAALALVAVAVVGDAAETGAVASARSAPAADGEGGRWLLPWPGASLERGFEAPEHEYGPGHRGVELRGAPPATVVAPADGTVAFAGSVAGRGVVTIDHGGGLVTTLEPLEAAVSVGAHVRRGEPVGTVSLGGDTAPGALHFGLRQDGVYIDPMRLIGEPQRAVLLPCC